MVSNRSSSVYAYLPTVPDWVGHFKGVGSNSGPAKTSWHRYRGLLATCANFCTVITDGLKCVWKPTTEAYRMYWTPENMRFCESNKA